MLLQREATVMDRNVVNKEMKGGEQVKEGRKVMVGEGNFTKGVSLENKREREREREDGV